MRHSRLVGKDEIVIGFKSARTRMALGMGTANTPMSEGSAYQKLRSLESKNCLQIVRTTHAGRLLKLYLPSEIPGVIPSPSIAPSITLEGMDFFTDEANRKALLERENYRCFYTLKKIDADNFVVDHVISRPVGDNGYKNCVAASREANNRKGASAASEFLRRLFREGWLSESEFEDRLEHLRLLQAGELRPPLQELPNRKAGR